MLRTLFAITAAAGLSVAVAGHADARRFDMGPTGHGIANAHTGFGAAGRMHAFRAREALSARASVRDPMFRPPGWSHGRKVGWHCRVGTRGCIPPGLR
jgi:hypothetical protein